MRIANDTYHVHMYERTYAPSTMPRTYASSTMSRHSGAETKNTSEYKSLWSESEQVHTISAVNIDDECTVGRRGRDDSIKQFSILVEYIISILVEYIISI